MFARAGIGNTYWSTIFPAVCLLGLGMTITVAPLTTTVMDAVEAAHSGVASGVNNTVARVAGLLAIAVFGIVLVGGFDAQVRPRLDRLSLSPEAKTQIEGQLPKMTGADLKSVTMDAPHRVAVQLAINEAFLSGFHVVVLGAAILALAAAAFGAAIPPHLPRGANAR
ncbi:MAG: hypothetical protein NVS1B5_18430 [Gemmatimonadaceae bacterium]